MAKSWFASSVASSRSVSTARSSMHVMRPVDKLGQELLRIGMQGIGDLAEVKTGDILNTVKVSLKGVKYNALCKNPDLCLDKVHYCQVELADVTKNLEAIRNLVSVHGDKSRAEKIKRLVNHDYLVIELLTGPDATAPKLHIQAEKTGFPSDNAGIHITVAEDYEQHAKNVTLYTVQCNRKRIGLEELLKVLENQNPNYSVAEHNCWEYARATTQRLLVACQELCSDAVDGGFQERQRLQKEIDELGGHISMNHLYNNGKRLARAVQLPLKGMFKSTSAASVGASQQAVETTTRTLTTATISVTDLSSVEGSHNIVDATTAAMAAANLSSAAPVQAGIHNALDATKAAACDSTSAASVQAGIQNALDATKDAYDAASAGASVQGIQNVLEAAKVAYDSTSAASIDG